MHQSVVSLPIFLSIDNVPQAKSNRQSRHFFPFRLTRFTISASSDNIAVENTSQLTSLLCSLFLVNVYRIILIKFDFYRQQILTLSSSSLCISGKFESDITRLTTNNGVVDRILKLIEMIKNEINENEPSSS
jgi:hypothetical protein